jgi:MFS family permease
MKLEIVPLLRADQLLRVMAAQAASTYANQIITFIIPWLILTRTGSALNAGMVAFSMGISSFIGILAGGLLIDRIGGHKVSMIADILSFITAFALALTLVFDFFSLWLVAISQVIGIFFDGPGTIAKNTLVPAAAEQNHVPMIRAMGLQQTLQNTAMFLGPVSAGFLIGMFTESITLLVTSILFLFCVLLIMGTDHRMILHEHAMTFHRAVTDVNEAIHFILQEPYLGPMQFFGLLYAFVLMPIPAVIFPSWFVFSSRESVSLGVFLGAQALGGVVGGLVFAAFAPRISQHKWLVGSTAGYGAALLSLYFLLPGSIPSIVVGFLAGAIFTGIMTIPYTAFYSRTPEHLLGRVNSIGAASGALVAACSSLFFGWLVQNTSASMGILVCALILIMMAVLGWFLPFMKLLDEKRQAVTHQEVLKTA